MFERLHTLKNQYEELLRRMEMPETYSDPKLYARCEREARELQPLVEAYAAWEQTEATMASAQELMEDPEMRQLAQEEYQEARKERERLEQEINRQGVTVLLIEQNANMALKTADIGYVLETGEITLSGSGRELLANEAVKKAYLGE